MELIAARKKRTFEAVTSSDGRPWLSHRHGSFGPPSSLGGSSPGALEYRQTSGKRPPRGEASGIARRPPSALSPPRESVCRRRHEPSRSFAATFLNASHFSVVVANHPALAIIKPKLETSIRRIPLSIVEAIQVYGTRESYL